MHELDHPERTAQASPYRGIRAEPAGSKQDCVLAAMRDLVLPQISPRRGLSHASAALPGGPSPLPGSLADEIQTMAIAGDLEAARARLETLAEAGIPQDRLLSEVIAEAGRRIGEGWETDRISFFDVTLGSGVLERLADEIVPISRLAAPDASRALVTVTNGETHTLGTTILASLLRLAGWLVYHEREPGTPADLAKLAQSSRPDAVIISVSADISRPLLAPTVAALRDSGAAVLLGGPLIAREPKLVEITGASGMIPSLDQAGLAALSQAMGAWRATAG